MDWIDFMYLAVANFMIPSMVGISPPSSLPEGRLAAMEGITDPVEVQEALAHSFRHARHAIARTPDSALDDLTMMFGREATKRNVLTLIVTHMHEHPGPVGRVCPNGGRDAALERRRQRGMTGDRLCRMITSPLFNLRPGSFP